MKTRSGKKVVVKIPTENAIKKMKKQEKLIKKTKETLKKANKILGSNSNKISENVKNMNKLIFKNNKMIKNMKNELDHCREILKGKDIDSKFKNGKMLYNIIESFFFTICSTYSTLFSSSEKCHVVYDYAEEKKEVVKLAMKADQQKMTSDQMSSQAELQREQLRQQSEDQRTMAELQARMEMNTDDNETAMRLAAAEIASGDKVAVSTGTGINPGV